MRTGKLDLTLFRLTDRELDAMLGTPLARHNPDLAQRVRGELRRRERSAWTSKRGAAESVAPGAVTHRR